jgi:hypothetical protein
MFKVIKLISRLLLCIGVVNYITLNASASNSSNAPSLSNQVSGVGQGRFAVADAAGGCGAALGLSDKIASFTSYSLSGVTSFTPKEYFEVMDFLTSKYDSDYDSDYVYDDLLQAPLGFPEDKASGNCAQEFGKALCLAYVKSIEFFSHLPSFILLCPIFVSFFYIIVHTNIFMYFVLYYCFVYNVFLTTVVHHHALKQVDKP